MISQVIQTDRNKFSDFMLKSSESLKLSSFMEELDAVKKTHCNLDSNVAINMALVIGQIFSVIENKPSPSKRELALYRVY